MARYSVVLVVDGRPGRAGGRHAFVAHHDRGWTVKDNVEYLPRWKENATAEDRFSELAMIARKHPEQFSMLIVVYAEEDDEGIRLRTIGSGATTYETLGMLVDAQRRILNGE